MASLDDFILQIKGDVVIPGHPSYAAAISRWARNAEREAQIVVFVKDTDDVAACIAYAKEHRLVFAIKGGGHQAAGASSALDGLVIDLSRYMGGVLINADDRLAFVGGGAVWKDVDESAIAHGLAAVAGTVNHTGVGGLTLGGGYGWLTGRHGMVLDNLTQASRSLFISLTYRLLRMLQATVVLADGSVKIAKESENSDLFWGIRGGGCNFGVVTEFVLRLHPQRSEVFAGVAVYSRDKVEYLVEVTTKWWARVSQDEVVMQYATTDEDKNPVVMVGFFFNGSEADGKVAFKDFFNLGPLIHDVQERPYESVNTLMNPLFEHGRCRYIRAVVQHHPDAASTLDILEKCSQTAAQLGTYTLGVLYEYIPPHAITSVDPSATAFKRITSGSQNIAMIVTWDDNVPENAQWAKSLLDEVTEGVIFARQTEIPEEDKPGYANHALDLTHDGVLRLGSAQVEKARKAFGDNLPRLRELKKKYDPEVFFNRWCPIPPAP